MNEVNVTKLKEEIAKYNSLLDSYQENYLNLYHEITNSKLYWSDPHAINFFDDKDLEKNRIDVSFEELKSIKEVYNLIINSYEKIGNFIEFNIANRDNILSKLNTYTNKLNRIMNSYNDLDYSFADSGIKSSINSQKSYIKEMIDNANILKNSIKTLLNNIVDNENKIRSAISNINVEILALPTTERFI